MKARGINDVTRVYEISDLNGGFGGPIMRDKLWFYGAARFETLDVSVVDNYYDKNPAPYLYEPDLDRPAHDSGDIPNESFRLTWQGTSKDKVQFWFTNQNKARAVLQHQRHRHARRRRAAGDEVRAADHVEVDADADEPPAARGRHGGRAYAVPQRLP